MKIRIFALGLACLAGLFGQNRKFSWQDSCFNHPGLPYCQGRDFAVKPTKPGKDGALGVGADMLPSASAAEDVSPSVISVGGIDWRFADPKADALASASFGNLAPSPVARTVFTALGTNQGINETDMKKILEAFSSIDRVAISMHGDQVLIMVTGASVDSILPRLESGWKAEPIPNGILIGPAQSVDQALARIYKEGPPPELARAAGSRQANGEFWAASSASVAGPEAVSAGAKRFVLKASMRDRLAIDSAFEFSQQPNASILGALPATPGVPSIEGNLFHVKMSTEADKVQQNLTEIAATPLGQYLAVLIKAGRYIPARDPSKAQPKPKIAGLDNL